jgi:hypothetical protein
MESPFCLCEMGAAWTSEKAIFPILVDIDYKAIEYPTTPFKTTQVAELNSMDKLVLIYDQLKDGGYIHARTGPFNTQLAIFLKKELWKYPVDVPPLMDQREKALNQLKPLSAYDLKQLEPS